MLRTRMVLLLFPLLASGCQQPSAEEAVEVNLLKRTSQCRIAEPGMRQLYSREEALQLLTPATLLRPEASLPEVDFATQAVVVLAMGQQPSTGYGIEIAPTGMRDGQGRLVIPVGFVTPNKGVVATLITTPCALFSVRREGIREIVAGTTGLTLQLAQEP